MADITGNKPSCFQRASNFIVGPLEQLFYKIGFAVGTRPLVTIVICLVVVGLFGIGFIKFTHVTDPDKLWIPLGSDYFKKIDWINIHFPSKTRFINLIVVADNVMAPSILQILNQIYNDVHAVTTSDGYNMSSVCFRYGEHCLIRGLPELWQYNTSVISTLTQQDIIDDVNSVTVSPQYLTIFEKTNYLGGTTLNIAGNITAAKATIMTWLTIGDQRNKHTPAGRLEKDVLESVRNSYSNVQVYGFTSRSFSDAAGGSIQSDMGLFSAGYFLLIVYVLVVLGRFNMVQQRIGLAFSGVMCIGMCIVVSFGFSSAIGVKYGPLHPVLPFLLLGIGIDDMFIIVGAFNNLTEEERQKNTPEKIAITLKHAGVSITVTSLTDVVAFFIGATTVLPALRSFSVYAAIGILAVFLLQSTFFVACLTLDIRRQNQYRNACVCCFVHKNYEPIDCSQRDLLPGFFRKIYSPLVVKLPVKIVIIVLTLALLGVNIWGFTNLQQDFDPTLFFEDDSDAKQYIIKREQYFPDTGKPAAVYCKNIDYFSSKTKLEKLYTDLSSSEYVSYGTTNSWFKAFTSWLSSSTDPWVAGKLDVNDYPVNGTCFDELLDHFVTNQSYGRRYQNNLKFNTDSPPSLRGSYITFTFRGFTSSKQRVKAMNGLEDCVNNIGFPYPGCFDYARAYRSWETDEVIQVELYRNIGLASAAVFLVTLVLIANIWTSILVFLCVVFTLVDLMGTMYMWGLTIDTVTCIHTVLAIGLVVDYSAHVGHTFMVYRGTRNKRTQATLDDIGPAVFNGGFSTFLAFVLLSRSKSYVFAVFFKVFLLVVLYGLWHGLAYLPAVLSLVGPNPYTTASRDFQDIKQIAHSERHDMENIHHHSDMQNGNSKKQDEGFSNSDNKTPAPDYPGAVALVKRSSSDTRDTPPEDYSPPVSPVQIPRVNIQFIQIGGAWRCDNLFS